MKLRFFTIPVYGGPQASDELNSFLSSHRVLSIERHLIVDGSNSAWAICTCYLESGGRPAPEKRGRVDYREILSESDFSVFARLRSLRKTLAEKEGVPAYALFTNEQLAEMVRRRVQSIAALERIEGVGQARSAKFGASFLEILKAESGVENDGREPT